MDTNHCGLLRGSRPRGNHLAYRFVIRPEQEAGSLGLLLVRQVQIRLDENTVADRRKCRRILQVTIQVDDKPRISAEYGRRAESFTQESRDSPGTGTRAAHGPSGSGGRTMRSAYSGNRRSSRWVPCSWGSA